MTLLVPWKHGRRAPSVRPFSWDLDEFDRLFGNLWSGFGGEAAREAPGFSPRVDIEETEEAYRITAELPGLSEQDFEVSVEADVLTIKGEKRDEREVGGEGYRQVETLCGAFERRFHLPTEVDADAISAKHENGVLTVTLPKAEIAKPRTIPVSGS